MNLGEAAKNSWEQAKIPAPLPRAERMSLEDFSSGLGIPIEDSLKALTSKGFTINNTKQSLADIAQQNKTSPDNLYEAIKSSGLKPVLPETTEGTGLGRKSLEIISAEKGIPIDEALFRLMKKGIQAKAQQSLKDIASKHGKTPTEILKIVEGKN
jgi:hypothetical protein